VFLGGLMPKINPTKSIDGADRINVNIPFRLSREELILILVNYFVAYGREDLPPGKVLKVIRERLRETGENAFYTDYAVDADFELAKAQIEKVWPNA